ncbi:MAG: HlyD family secretion protein, partial [Blastocatellia bacterium]
MSILKTKKKAIIVGAVLLGLATIVILSKSLQTGDQEPVQTSKVKKVAKLDSKVTASGEVRPVQFYDLTAQVSGRVQELFVHEGDTVKKHQPLVRVDPTQLSLQTQGAEANERAAEADDANARVAVTSAENEANQAKSNLLSAEGDMARDQALMRFQENEFKRNQQLIEEGVISKSAFDQVRSNYEQQEAVVDSQKARITQLKQAAADAQLTVDKARASEKSAEGRVKVAKANMAQQSDLLGRTTEYSPIDGVVSSLPVKVGEFALAN